MRIAVFHELPSGGARIATNEIAQRLKKTSKIDLYYVDSNESEEEYKNYTNVFFFPFLEKKWSGRNPLVRIYKDSIELLKLRALHKKIAKEIDNKNYDVVFVNASRFIEAPFILSFLKTKSVFYLHDPHFRMIYEKGLSISQDLDFFRRNYEKLHRAVLKKIDSDNISSATVLIANSFFTQKQALKSYKKNSIVSYLGIDIDFFKSSNKKRGIDILYVGSKDAVDGYSLLMEVIKHMKKNPKIRQVLKETEWVSREKMRELYQRTKIVLALATNEPFGLTPLEAAACGAPTVAIQEGGYVETIIDGKTGYLVNKNAKLIAQKLDFLLSHPSRLKKMGQEAKLNVVANWDWNKRIKLLEATLNQIDNNYEKHN